MLEPLIGALLAGVPYVGLVMFTAWARDRKKEPKA